LTDPRGIDRLFIDSPSGFTPLAKKIREVIAFARENTDKTKKVLLFIATDGLPTYDDGYPNLDEFKRVIRDEIDHEKIHIMFLLCTDEQESVDYLTAFRTTVPNVHVCDDYETERRSMRHVYGGNYQFTRTDYYIHALFALSFQFSFGVNTFFHFTTHRTNLKERMGNCCSGLQKDGKNGPPPPDRQSGPPPPPVRGRDDDNRGGDPRGGGPGPAGRQKK
ncbi:unnamed protein product, partial [Adineta ricciae]